MYIDVCAHLGYNPITTNRTILHHVWRKWQKVSSTRSRENNDEDLARRVQKLHATSEYHQQEYVRLDYKSSEYKHDIHTR
jgi:hypothetical protein